MLVVGVEDDPGYQGLCDLCDEGEEGALHPTFYVVLWHSPRERTRGGALRMCFEHADELCRLLLESLP